jgi:release factor glutamine methyltransferase
MTRMPITTSTSAPMPTSASTLLPTTLARALRGAASLGLERLDAQLLLLHALGRPAHDRAWLLAHDGDAVPQAVWSRFLEHAARRIAGEPIAYLLGEKEFHGLALRVDARVLVPRPDTETLVDWALDLLRERDAGRRASSDTADAPSILDLGTGSGAVALALQHAWPLARVHAVDASADALEVARDNARRLGLPVHFSQADWLDGAATGFDLIVGNPPYIAEGDPHLAALSHEPASALVAGADGLADLRRIVRDAPAHLRPGGHLLLEHGHDQDSAVRELLATRGFDRVDSRRDLADIARCSGGRWPGPGADMAPGANARHATVK